MVIAISLLAGLLLLALTATIFYKFSWGLIHLAVLITSLFVINVLSGDDSLYLIISFVIIGASAGYSIRHQKNLLSFILVSSLSIAFIFTFNHYYLRNYKNTDILEDSKSGILSLMEGNNLPDSEKKELIQKIDESLEIIVQIIPFAYFFNSLMLSLFSLIFIKFIFNRYERRIKDKKEKESDAAGINPIIPADSGLFSVEKFRIKEYLIFIFIAGCLIVLLVDRNTNYFLYIAGLNTALILACFYLIQALGIIKYYFAKKNIPSLIVPIVLSVILLVGMEYFLFILVILSGIGIIDFWADFRKLNEAEVTDK